MFNIILNNVSANATIVDATGAITITDNDTEPFVSIADKTIDEGNAGTVLVTMTNPTTGNVTFTYVFSAISATSGQDYNHAAGVGTITAGATGTTIGIFVQEDFIDENDETFAILISNISSNGQIADGTGIVTINDNDTTAISITDDTQEEGNDLTFVVTLSIPSVNTVTVDYATVDGTAISGSDYVGETGTITFNPGVMTGTIVISGSEDLLDEANETFTISLTNASQATISDGTADALILDDDGTPTLNIADTSAGEGQPVVFTVSLSSLTASPVSFDYTTVNGTATAGSDYVAKTGTVTIPATTISTTITITGLDDTIYEGNETFSVVLSNISASATAGQLTGEATIVENELIPAVTINNVTENEGTTLVFTVSLNHPSVQNVSVTYVASGITATSGADYTHVGGTLVISAGATTGTISIPTATDSIYEPNETVAMRLIGITNGTIGDNE